jgi:hypothetical protein
MLELSRDDIPRVRKVLVDAQKAVDPKAWAYKVKGNWEKQLAPEVEHQKEIDQWRPTKGQYPEIDYSHPQQSYYIKSKLDGKRLYLDWAMVERMVNAERDRLGLG